MLGVVNFMIQMPEVRFIQLQIKGQERHTMVAMGKTLVEEYKRL